MLDRIHRRLAEKLARGLQLVGPVQSDQQPKRLPSRHQPSGAETSLEAAFLARQLQIAGEHRMTH
jgi:hypothetical protein